MGAESVGRLTDSTCTLYDFLKANHAFVYNPAATNNTGTSNDAMTIPIHFNTCFTCTSYGKTGRLFSETR